MRLRWSYGETIEGTLLELTQRQLGIKVTVH